MISAVCTRTLHHRALHVLPKSLWRNGFPYQTTHASPLNRVSPRLLVLTHILRLFNTTGKPLSNYSENVALASYVELCAILEYDRNRKIN
jgi:hypothetical protein